MKKFFVFPLVLVLLAGTVTPAFAAGVKPVEPKLFMSWPDTALPGETHTVSLTAKNVGKTPCLINWRIVFPKSLVADVKMSVGGKMLTDKSTRANWVFLWKKTGLKPNISATVEFQVTLKSDLSSQVYNLVSVYSGKTLLDTGNVNVQSPSLVWTISAPEEMIYGGRPFSALITVTNPSSVDLPFDVSVEMFHNATDGSNHYQAYGGEVYGLSGGQTSITISWHGTVPAGEQFTLELATGSGRYLGFFNLLIVKDQIFGVTLMEHSYELVTGTGIPYGELKVTGVNAGPIKPGDMLAFESYYFAPTLGQFQVTRVEVSPNCPIQGLPLGSTSGYGITYAHFLHYVTLLPMEKPAGVTGPYVVTCSLTSTFNMWGDPITEFHGNGSFEVTIP